MSFVDLATLTMHRRHELESRINLFEEKCNVAIGDIKKLKVKSRGFVSQLNCEPNELKDRFLMFMKKVDEYMYLITDFNLAVTQLDDIGYSDNTPVQDNSQNIQRSLPAPLEPTNLIDALSEPRPSTSCACTNLCPPEKPKRIKVPKEEQTLIAFSSSSSSESVPSKKFDMTTTEVQCKLNEDMASLSFKEPSPDCPILCNIPKQTILEVDHLYEGTIMTVDGALFWVITDNIDEARQFMLRMTDYYTENKVMLTSDQVKNLACCAYFDEQSVCYYRALYLRHVDDENAELFVVDTGEIVTVPINCIHPLVEEFSDRPPYARSCHLAGFDFDNSLDDEDMAKLDSFLKQYIGTLCTIEVDDNSSESLGVYVMLPSKETVNDLIIQRGIIKNITVDKSRRSQSQSPAPRGPPEFASDNLSMDYGPEYDDPVEAVTGYHNRDEADICKHYKGGPEKTCFKGHRCTKRHVMKHPDGWTLDRVEVTGKIKPFPLPAPGTWHRVMVTTVCHFDRIYVQIVTDKKEAELREFGVMLPPMTLESLLADMNSAATRRALKPITLAPAPGEVVAALYPHDRCWYRARVLSVTRADQNVQVIFLDYGTIMSVHEDEIKVLEPRFTVLPVQAIQCVLAGVKAKSHDSKQWAVAKKTLTAMTQNIVFNAHIIARDYDEVTIALYDVDLRVNIAEQLAALGHIELQEYSVIEDTNVTSIVAMVLSYMYNQATWRLYKKLSIN